MYALIHSEKNKGNMKKLIRNRIINLIIYNLNKYLVHISEIATIKKNKNYCIICEKNCPTFLPFGLTKRPNALCPNCHSLERDRLIYCFLKERTNFFRAKIRLLHVAPEMPFYNLFINSKNIHYLPCDLTPENFPFENSIRKIDLTNIPLEDNSFDVILCSHVLEHIIDDLTAMKEIYRVLSPGGWAILHVPIDNKREFTFEDFSLTSDEDREMAFGQKDHVRVYGKDYPARLKKAGFYVEEVDVLNNFSSAKKSKYGLLTEKLFVVKK
jgi:SAM-dependent methyltransferase